MIFWKKITLTISLTLLVVFSIRHIALPDEKKAASLVPMQIKSTGEKLLRGEAVYNYYCAPCHGLQGNGKGPNADYLSTRPRNFTDRLYMATKSDRDLFQTVNGGGRAVGLSFLMPPWGDTWPKQSQLDVIVYVRTFEKIKIKE